MGLIRHRRFRRQETVPEDDNEQADNVDDEEEAGDDEEDEEDDDDSSGTTVPSSLSLPTSTENQFDKAKAIGEEVIKKVPSKLYPN